MSDPVQDLVPKEESDSPIRDDTRGLQGEHFNDVASLEHPPPPKRKGGRKPIYATTEERKQRNRQAQAAFRGRRTEYIKQLEATSKDHDETMDELRLKNQALTAECTRLGYKTTLLERLLDEHSVDYRAELQARTHNLFASPADRDFSTTRFYSSGMERKRQAIAHRINSTSRKPSSSAGLVHIQPAGPSSGQSSASTLPSPSSLSYPSPSPDTPNIPLMASAEVLRPRPAQYNGSLPRDPSNHHLPINQDPGTSRHRGSIEHESKEVQNVADYRNAGHYDYIDAVQHTSQQGLTSSYLAQQRLPLSPYVPDTSSPEMDTSQMPTGFTNYPFDEMRQLAQQRSWMRQNSSRLVDMPVYYGD